MKIANTYVMPAAALSGIGPVAVLDGFNALLGPPPLPNGFIYHGAEIDIMGGSYGRIQGLAQAGRQIGDVAMYVAYSGISDDGWQKHSGAKNVQVHGDLGWRGGGNEFHLIAHGVSGDSRGALLSPIELIAVDPTAQLNYPNYFKTNSIHLNLTGNYALGDGWVARSNFSFGQFSSRQLITLGGAVVGNCQGDPNLLCSLGAPYVDINGNQFHAIPGVKNYAYQEYLLSNTTSWGATASASHPGEFMGRPNNFTVGVNYNGANATAGYHQYLGSMKDDGGFGLNLGETNDLPVGQPQEAKVLANYVGIYAADVFDITDKLKVAAGGRYSYSNVDQHDVLGTIPAVNENVTYTHFAPSLGWTYALTPGLIGYAGYSEVARVLAPAGMFCEDMDSACNSIPPWFVADVITKQAVYHTYEGGFRGQQAFNLPIAPVQIAWNAAVYRTDISDYTYVAASTGRPSLADVGDVRRQGVKLGAELIAGPWTTSINYIYTDATFQSYFRLFQPLNTGASASGYIYVHPGNTIPNEPAHVLRVSTKYNVTKDWAVGASFRAVSSSYYFGDEINVMGKVPGYFVMGFNTQYHFDRHLEVFGIVENAFNVRYPITGGLTATASIPIAEAPGATNPRAWGLGQPFSVYGGVKYKF
jgi:outer membrane receptor protein involved in Fe transport